MSPQQPSIFYSMVGLIGRERSIVLCEQAATPASGCEAIARKILAKIAARSDKKSYGYEGYPQCPTLPRSRYACIALDRSRGAMPYG